MAAFIGNHTTRAGQNLIAKALAGKTIKFTKIVLGDGMLDGDDVMELEAVKSPKVTVEIVRKLVVDPCTAIIGGAYVNNETSEGFFWREVGLYAQDPDDQSEKLYSYGNAGDLAEYIPPSGGQTIVEKTIDLVTAVGDATHIEIAVRAEAYATVQQYEEYKAIAEAARAAAEAVRDAEAQRVKNEEARQSYFKDIKDKVAAGDFDGATFTPSVEGGTLKWTNDKGKPNPPDADITGPPGKFSSVTASADNKHLDEPTVEVTLGGEAGAQTLNLAFSGLMGSPGDPSTLFTGSASQITLGDGTPKDISTFFKENAPALREAIGAVDKTHMGLVKQLPENPNVEE